VLYFWCGHSICLKSTVGGEVLHLYYPQGFVIPSGSQGAGGYYYISDALGSVRQVWGTTEDVKNVYAYDAYGNELVTYMYVPDEIQFAGYLHHAATGLDFAEHRVYNPQYGRWLSRDPIGVAGGANLYRYANDDPASLSDPSGNCPWCIGAAAGAVAGGALGYYTSGGSWATAAEYAGLGAIAGGSGAALGVLAGGGSLVEALGVGAVGLTRSVAPDDLPALAPDFPSISDKIAAQLDPRGWTLEQIAQAMASGDQIPAIDKATGDAAIRYINPDTGQSVVVNTVTNAVIQVGGPGFKFGPASRDCK
jgi:RHS repeat-associated protein